MAEYIEREAALDIVNDWRNQLIPIYGENDEYVKCLETVAEYLESLHATDVRPVVLCRDCKNYIERSGACAYLVVGMREDDFCSYGKKREES